MYGLFLSFLGTSLYTCVYILNECGSHVKSLATASYQLCYRIGFAGTVLMVGYIAVTSLIEEFSTSAATSVVTTSTAATSTSTSGFGAYILFLYSCLLLSHLIHNYTYFNMVARPSSGALGAGLMQALRAVLVFILSAIFFCQYQVCVFPFLSHVLLLAALLCRSLSRSHLPLFCSQASQCFDFPKLISTAVVSSGVIGYTQSS
jgi:hypothetical protein